MRAHKRQLLGMLIVAVSGLCFLGSYALRCKSNDYFLWLRSSLTQGQHLATERVRIVFVDVNEIASPTPYARLLADLTKWQAQAVVFDIVFTNRFWSTDKSTNDFVEAFVHATNAGVKVVFAAQGGEVRPDGVTEEITPTEWILDLVESHSPSRTAGIGVSDLAKQRSDGLVRRYSLTSKYAHDPLAVETAILLNLFQGERKTHWISYYGPPGTIRAVNLRDISAPNEDLHKLFAHKVVFVGQGPPAADQQVGLDQHRTPFTTSVGGMSTGVEIHATTLCNLIQDDWLKEPPSIVDWMMVLTVGILSGIYFPKQPLRRVFLGVIAVAVVVTVSSFLVFSNAPYLLPWAVIAGPQMIAAVAIAFLPLKTAFVSYRRVDGRDVAVFIASELNRRGIEAFIDIKAHTSGRLEEILFPQIAQRKNFILLLTPAVHERWRAGHGADKDWIGQEIDHAVGLERNIIPVPTDDFRSLLEKHGQDEAILPGEIQNVLDTYKRSSYSSEQPDSSVEGIARSLKYAFRRL